MSWPSPQLIACWRERSAIVQDRLNRAKRSYKREYPRHREEWSVAEDRRLLKGAALIHRLPKSARRLAWFELGRKLGRSSNSLLTREQALKAGMRLVKRRRRKQHVSPSK